MKIISAFEINDNLINTIGKDWMLVTAGNREKFNTMTVSWGGTGILWNKPVAFTFIRHQRYTFDFIENNQYFTMSAYGDEFRNALKLCGTKSGRDIDKAKETGLIPVFTEEAPYFEHARLVLVCRKMYAQDLNEQSIIDSSILNSYNGNDYCLEYSTEEGRYSLLRKK